MGRNSKKFLNRYADKGSLLIVGVHIVFVMMSFFPFVNDLKEESIMYGVIMNMAYQILQIILISVFLNEYLRKSSNDFRKKRKGEIAKNVLIGFGIVVVINFAYRALVLIANVNVGISTNQVNNIEYIMYHPILTFMMSVCMAPFTEEVIYRGILFQFFEKKGIWLACCVTSVLFGLLHVVTTIAKGNYTDAKEFTFIFLTYIVAGVSLSAVYVKYKNLCVNIIVHSLWNFIGTSLIMLKV